MTKKPPILPPKAKREILSILSKQMSISSDEIAAILAENGVTGDEEALQNSYRKRLGQRLIASIRDENGQRELFAAGSDYIIINCCNDPKNFVRFKRSCKSTWRVWTNQARRCADVFAF